jgi:hypothetical protein
MASLRPRSARDSRRVHDPSTPAPQAGRQRQDRWHRKEIEIVFGTLLRLLAALVLVGLLGGIGVSVYQAGFAAGAAAGGATIVAPIGPYGWWGPGWGFGGLLFGFIGLLILIFIVGGLLRAIFWRGPRWSHGSWGRHGTWGPGGPEGFRGGPWEARARELHDEWHRRHDGDAAASSGQPAGADSAS